MTTDEAERPGLLNGDVLGQMLLAQSRFLDALERRDRVTVAPANMPKRAIQMPAGSRRRHRITLADSLGWLALVILMAVLAYVRVGPSGSRSTGRGALSVLRVPYWWSPS